MLLGLKSLLCVCSLCEELDISCLGTDLIMAFRSSQDKGSMRVVSYNVAGVTVAQVNATFYTVNADYVELRLAQFLANHLDKLALIGWQAPVN